MKQTILRSQTPQQMRKKIRRRIVLCVVLVLLTVALNAAGLLMLRQTAPTLGLFVNILSDVLCGGFIFWYTDFYIRPQRSLLRLAQRETIAFSGIVTQISEDTTRYLDMDCLEIVLASRRLYLPKGTICLSVGTAYRFRVASNVIVEAEE